MRNLEYKQKIFEQYLRLNEPVALKRGGIVPIVHYSWVRSFARIDKNLKTMAVRGWNPLNEALLIDPDILATKRKASTAIVPYSTAPVTIGDTSNNAIVLYNGGRPTSHIPVASLNDVLLSGSSSTTRDLTNRSNASNTNTEVHHLLNLLISQKDLQVIS